MEEAIEEAAFQAVSTGPYDFNADIFEQVLAELGYMIVPIEDPTNLRFGVDE